VREVVLKHEGADPTRTDVVHNGIDPPRRGKRAADSSQVRRELDLPSGCLIVGMVANFNRRVKGLTYFLDAVPAIVRSVPNVRFLILGRGKEEEALRRQARSLGVDGYVIFAGYREDVDRCYRAMDVSVLTSLTEGLSLTLLESMNHGLPVVVTNVGGNPELVTDGETGFLVPPRDVKAFATKVIELLRRPELRSRMGAAAQRKIESQFRLETIAARYLEVYSSVLMGSTGAWDKCR
jgi:glycosyltransferase involved in cell wall biosynthesis